MKQILRKAGFLKEAKGKPPLASKSGDRAVQAKTSVNRGRSTAGRQRPASPADSDSHGVVDRGLTVRKPRSVKRLESFESLPAHHGLAFGSDGRPFVNNRELRQDYAVLFEDKRQTRVMLISSLDVSRGDVGVDTNLLTIKDRISTAGLSVTEHFRCERHILGKIYEQYSSGSKLSPVEQGRAKKEFWRVIRKAIDAGTSDVHVEVRRESALVRFRLKGDLVDVDHISVKQASDMAQVVYNVIAEQKDMVFIPSKMQDAVIDRAIDGVRVRIRLATGPAAPDGFDMVLRILPTGLESHKALSELGYTPEQMEDIALAMQEPIGLTVLAGVTGSGKTTSLASLLNQLIRDSDGKIKVITVENPVEIVIDRATQIPVVLNRDGEPGGGSPFAKPIRAAMRLDPDVLMLGEIRDEDTAELAARATQSGHKSLATLHAPSAFGVPDRLLSFGVSSTLLGSDEFLACLIYQSLVRLTCPHCSIALSEWESRVRKPAEKATLQRVYEIIPASAHDTMRFRNPTGCDRCSSGSPEPGREVVAEVVRVDEDMRRLLATGKNSEAKRRWLRTGGQTTMMVALQKVMDGRMDVRDVESKLGPITKVLGTFRMSGLDPSAFGLRQDLLDHDEAAEPGVSEVAGSGFCEGHSNEHGGKEPVPPRAPRSLDLSHSDPSTGEVLSLPQDRTGPEG